MAITLQKFEGPTLIEVTFEGSFQCRLATNPDQSHASPSFPSSIGNSGIPGLKPTPDGVGGTFTYGEDRFDRVIRMSNPVQLRKALIDPWVDTTVVKIRYWTNLSRSMTSQDEELKQPWETSPPQTWSETFTPANDGSADTAFGKKVSIGTPTADRKGVYFAAHEQGGREGREALVNFHFELEGILEGDAQAPPIPKQPSPKDVKEWSVQYRDTKPQRIIASSSQMNATRLAYLKEHPVNYDFEGSRIYDNIVLNNLRYNQSDSLLAEMSTNPDTIAEVCLVFFRFDGDTLTGQVCGSLRVRTPSTPSPGPLLPGRFYERYPKLKGS